jgi:glycosyltransferase involved in cell wall biosynthesis
VRGNLLRGLRGTEARSVYSGTLLPAFSENRLKRALQRQWIRHSVQRVDHLVVSSGVMRTFYESLGVTTPIAVIPNGVDLQRFRRPESDSEKRAERRRLGISDTADLILFIGSIIRRKGIDTLLLAFKSVAASNPRAELIMVGPLAAQASSGYSQFARHVHDLVRSSGAEDRIHFTGEVADVAAYLRAADLFVFPSRREGMGNVVLEAMATSLPAVLTPYEGLPSEFGEPGTQYVLVDRDPESLAAHMLMLLRDQGKRRTIGTAARRWVEEHMSLSMVIDSYVTLYRDLAAGNILRSDGQEA